MEKETTKNFENQKADYRNGKCKYEEFDVYKTNMDLSLNTRSLSEKDYRNDRRYRDDMDPVKYGV